MYACVSTGLSLSAERRSQRLENSQRSIQNTVCNGGGFGFLLGLADYRGKYSDVGRDSDNGLYGPAFSGVVVTITGRQEQGAQKIDSFRRKGYEKTP